MPVVNKFDFVVNADSKTSNHTESCNTECLSHTEDQINSEESLNENVDEDICSSNSESPTDSHGQKSQIS